MIASNAVGRSVPASPPYSTSAPFAPRRTSAEGTCMKDVVIVGGGLAGLSAGWRLRHWDTVLLESEQPGGRPHPLGAPRPVLAELGRARLRRPGIVHRRPAATRSASPRSQVPGSLAGLSMNGKLLLKRPDRDLPVPHPHVAVVARRASSRPASRSAAQVLRYANVVRQRPGEDPARSGSSGSTTSRTAAASRTSWATCPRTPQRCSSPTVTRSAADTDEISAGAGIGYFSLVWNIGQGLNRSIVGGPSTLTEGIADGAGRPGAARRRGRRDRAQEATRSSSATGRTESTTRSRRAASSWPPRPR